MNRCEQLRLDARLTVDELARRADVPAKVVYRLEQGKGTSVERLGRVADALKARPSTLLLPAQTDSEAAA